MIKKSLSQRTMCVAVRTRSTAAAASTFRDVALSEVLWSTGLRRSEIERLQIADVNLSESFLAVRTSKTGRPRVVPLSPQAQHALRNGVSETSVRAAAGWSIGGMVSRCTNALSGELAITEFQRSWGPNQQKHQTQFARELLQMGQYTTNQCEVFRGCR